MDLISLSKVIPKVLTPEECQVFIDEFEKKKVMSGYEMSQNIEGVLTKSTFRVIELKEGTQPYNFLLDKMNYCLIEWIKYLETFDCFHTPILKHSLRFPHKIRILRYNVGESIHEHSDWEPFTHASVTINLNENYEGGDFNFFNRKETVKLSQGDALIFPADYFWVHGVSPVTKGKRYSVNSFIRSFTDKEVSNILESSNWINPNRDRKFTL